MIRISTGFFKGRVLKSAKDPSVRPTMARIKLSFFDIVQDQIREKIFLDGFAGTGNIGIEALSRGSEFVVFVDILPEAAKVIEHNLVKIGVAPDRYRIICGDFNRAIIQLAKSGFVFDFVYLDPPYELLDVANPLKVIFKRHVLRPDGTIILEKPVDKKFESKYFTVKRSHPIGHKTLEFFTY
jgi:16S rRNA (guanine966-N2)-methyltransferase